MDNYIFRIISFVGCFLCLSKGEAQTSPALNYGTYLGDSGEEQYAVTTVDAEGNIYFFGTTSSTNLATEGAYMTAPQSLYDCWLAKMNPDGAAIWSTYFGGSNNDAAHAIKVDTQGNIYVSGITSSVDFPLQGDVLMNEMVSSSSPFLAKFDNNGTLIWSGYFDSMTSAESIKTIELSELDQRCYLLGANFIGGLATAGAFYTLTENVSAPILSAFDLDGNIIYTTYFFANTNAEDIVVDESGNLYLAGGTSLLYDMNTDGVHKSQPEGIDGFIMQIDSDGWPTWGTYFGGEEDDLIQDICFDQIGNICFGGGTSSGTSIAAENAYQTEKSGTYEGMIGKFNSVGQLLWSSYFGTSDNWDSVFNVTIDDDNNMYPTITTFVPSVVSISQNTYQFQPGGGMYDQIVGRFDQDGSMDWVTYLGGDANDDIYSLHALPNNELLISGITSSSNNIASEGALRTTLGGYTDAFMMRFNTTPCSFGCTNLGATNYNPLATCDDGSCFISQGSDLNGDGIVNISDLMLLLDAFGCIEDCLYDLNGDQLIGADDIVVLLGEIE